MVSEMFVDALQKKIKVSAYMDNKSSYDAIHSSTSVQDAKKIDKLAVDAHFLLPPGGALPI